MSKSASQICLFVTVTIVILSTLVFVPSVNAWIFWKYNAGEEVVDVRMSTDGNYIVAVTDWPANVILLDSSGSLVWKKSVSDRLESVSISGNGSRIVVGTSYKDVLLFDSNGNLLWEKELTTSSLYDVDISTDGRYIVLGGYNNVTYVYDNMGVQVWNFTLGDWVQSVSISSYGEYVAAGSWDDFVYLFNGDGELLWNFNTTWAVYAVSVSPEGDFVAAGNSYGNVSFFDNSGNRLWQTAVGDSDGVSVSANGEYIAVAERYSDKITLLNKTGAILWEWQAADYVNNVDISDDGRYVVAGSSDEHVYFLENLKPSTITCNRSQAQLLLGEPVTISGSIDPPHEGVEVTLNYTKPDKSVMTRNAISSVDGSFSDTFTPEAAGMWSVTAWWSGNLEYMGAKSSSKKFLVSTVKDVAVRIGKNRTLFDDFEPPGSYSWPLFGGLEYNESISCPPGINYTTQSVTCWYETLFGMPGDITSFNITYIIEAFEQTVEGMYEVEAVYELYTYYSSIFGKSYTFLFSYKIKLQVNAVTKYGSSISLTVFPLDVRLGENISISGAITSGGEIAISGAEIELNYGKPDGSALTRMVNTVFNGSFAESYAPDMLGSWTVNATWLGDEDHYGAVSSTVSFDVLADLTHQIVWETDTYNVRTLTNSTLQDFIFNQQLMQISFNVEGLSGRKGFCNITIPKSLLRGNPWAITIDDAPISDPEVTESPTHTSLYFTYTHGSIYHVIIQGTWVIPEFSLAMILLSLMMVTTLVAIAHKKKHFSKPR